MTIDLTTDVGKVRLLIPDRVETDFIYSDEELEAFLGLEGSSVKRAAALALETIASDQAYTLKAIKLLQLTTDGPKVATALMQRATKLREQAEVDEATEAGGGFDIAEWVLNPFTELERYTKQRERLGL